MKQLTLMDLPDDGDYPQIPASARAGSSKPARVAYSRLPLGHRRQLCHDCVELIHEIGVVAAPLPSTARQRRTSGTDVRALCQGHVEARKLAEGKANR